MLPKKLTRAILQRIAALWIAGLIVLSLQPVRVHKISGRTLGHQIEHVLLFGATAMMLLMLARNRREIFNAVGGVVLLAMGIEISQFLIYSLPAFEWWDVREDTIGAVIAWMAWQIRPVTVG